MRYFTLLNKPSFKGVAFTDTMIARFGGPFPITLRQKPTVSMIGTMDIFDGTSALTINNSSLTVNAFVGSAEVFEVDGFTVATGTTVKSRPLTSTQALFNQFLINAEF
jgi:hypothetical protein